MTEPETPSLESRACDLVAHVSHEMRAPLSAIKGYAETLLQGALEDPRHRTRFVRTIERHADRLLELVDDLLHLAALDGGTKPRPEPVELHDAVRRAFQDLRLHARRRRISLNARVEEGLRVRVDKCQLSQVLENLFVNAIKYNRRMGRIDVAGRREGTAALLSVADTGIGIEPQDVSRIFERFHRGDNARRRSHGSGLGLNIVKRIVEGHGGRVWVESAPRRGSTFSLYLPLAD